MYVLANGEESACGWYDNSLRKKASVENQSFKATMR
jgi:hypothetical protein